MAFATHDVTVLGPGISGHEVLDTATGDHLFYVPDTMAETLQYALAAFNSGLARGAREGREAVKASFRQLLGI